MIAFLVGFFTVTGCKKPPLIDNLYTVPDPVQNWNRVNPGSADRAWRHTQNHAVIYVDVNCESKFRDRSLSDSMLSLFWGIKVGDIIEQSHFTISNRAALYRVVNGEIDGVQARLGGIVVSKNACLYDFILISEPSHYPANAVDFIQLAQGLRTPQLNTLSTSDN